MKKITTQTWTVIYRLVAVATLSLFLVFSILTYYDGLSQYFSQDQDLTAERITTFLKDRNKPSLTTGSNLSNIIVGLPAKRLRGWLDAHFKQGDHIIGNIYYTRVLPFSLIQVTIALLLLFSCSLLLGKLSDWRLKDDYLYYLLSLAVVLNFPMLKGLCKVVKYDCLSIIVGALALLSYLVARKRSSVCYFLLAIFLSALAYIEKDTTISVLFFIALSECTLFYFSERLTAKGALRLFVSMLIIASVFLLTMFAAVPKMWRDPSELARLLSSTIPAYGVPSNPKLFLPAAGVLVLLFAARRYVVLALTKVRHYFGPWVVFAVLGALFLFALVYQKNDLKWTYSAAVDAEVRSQGLYVSPTMAGVALTTLDKSALLTRAKYVLAEGRLIIYFLPEILVLMLVFSPVVVGRIKYTLDRKMVIMIAAFCVLHLSAYAYLLVPVEAKYLTLVMFALVLLLASFLSGITKQLFEKRVSAGLVATVAIIVSLIVPACQNAPAFFGYMNIFRSRSAEDIASIKVDDYTFWTWMGWGETSYRLVNFASQNAAGKDVTVGFDYAPPMYNPGNTTMINTQEIWQFDERAKLDEYLKRISSLDYIIVSKNTANRHLTLNQLLREKRDRAVYVDRQGGIEYGWLFRPADLSSK